MILPFGCGCAALRPLRRRVRGDEWTGVDIVREFRRMRARRRLIGRVQTRGSVCPSQNRVIIARYFSAAKHSKTRDSRVEKCMRQILNGKGLTDQ